MKIKFLLILLILILFYMIIYISTLQSSYQNKINDLELKIHNQKVDIKSKNDLIFALKDENKNLYDRNNFLSKCINLDNFLKEN